MTSTQRTLAFEWALGFLILPCVLVLSPLVAIWWWWDVLTDYIEAERSRLARNEWLYKQVHESQERKETV